MGQHLARADLMARKTTTVTITAEGRDNGRCYVLTEMSASQAEKWAARALLALGAAGVDIPEGIEAQGLAGVAAIGVRAFVGLPWHLAEPLLDEMFGCIMFMPDPTRPQVIRGLIEDDIEEVATRVRLREEVISLHLGFSVAAYISKFRQAATQTTPENTSITSTSPAPSP
jgi:hypothetical protein